MDDQNILYDLLQEAKKQTALLNRLVLLLQTDLILKEVFDITGKPRSVEDLHKSLTNGYKAAIDYLATFSQIEQQKMISDLEKSLGLSDPNARSEFE